MSDPHFALAGYELLGKLGEGGMAVVWKARQISLDRIVAIKTLAPQWLQDADALVRFRQEAQAAARLKHSGIVQVFDAGETKDVVYYIMEYIQGYTLADRIQRKGPLDEATALQVALGVALALDYAWETARMIHCDIKPDNLMIDRDGSVKVADLGLARALGQKLGATDQDFIVGTPNYISPEQARGEQDLDVRTDIYALGATLYHLVTGRLPFGDTPGTAPLERQQKDFLLDPLDLNPQLSSPLATLIEKMMIKDRRYRPASWTEVIDDIQEVEDGFLPAGELPAQGISTVMRGEWRSAHPGKRRAQRTTRKKIVMSSATPGPVAAASTSRMPLAVILLITLAGLAGLAYGGLYLYQRAKAAAGRQAISRVTEPGLTNPVPSTKSEGAPENQTPSVPSPPLPAATNTPPVIGPNGTIHSPHYLRGASFFNYAFDLYRNFHGPDMTLPVFTRLETACRQAISDFSACREMTTDRATVEQHLTNCHKLLANARLSTKMARPGKPAPLALPPLPSLDLPAETVSPPPIVNPPQPATNPPKPEVKPTPVVVDEAALATAWKKPPAQRTALLTDFRDLLSLYPLEDENLAAGKELILYDRIRYGMPAGEAAGLFDQPAGERLPILSPLFPPDQYAYRELAIPPANGCTHLLLVVDPGDRVIAVQLINDLPNDELQLPKALFQSRWRYYDFVRAAEKNNPQAKVGYRVALIGRLARLDSELANNDDAAPLGLGTARARSLLFLPQAIACRIFNRIEQL